MVGAWCSAGNAAFAGSLAPGLRQGMFVLLGF